jgi:GntR family transcriptional repressor for pyruvate dehydrogenase complex
MSEKLNRRRSLSDAVFDRIQRAIKSGAYGVGERLPTEHTLATEFQVSRPVVRDALQRLRDQGLIYSRRGAGSFVREQGLREPLGFGHMENLSQLQHCYDFRLTIEPEAAALAAARQPVEAIGEINTVLNQSRGNTNRQAQANSDFMFHLSIAQASGNPYFIKAVEALEDHLAVEMRLHGLSMGAIGNGLRLVFVEHSAIYEAIIGGDSDAARALMKKHLTCSRDRLFEPER